MTVKHKSYGRIEEPELPIVGWDMPKRKTGGGNDEPSPVSSEEEFQDEVLSF